MRAVLQRVKQARVTVEGETLGTIEAGLLVFICAEDGDAERDAEFLASKVAKMRIFADSDGKMNRSVLDVRGVVLAVSQFTLAATWRKGNRPSFKRASEPVRGQVLYEGFCDALGKEGVRVETGVFGAAMEVSLINDGPVTIWMDSKDPN